jgi:hypothetical protein
MEWWANLRGDWRLANCAFLTAPGNGKMQMANGKMHPLQSHVLFGALRLRQPRSVCGGVLLAVYGLRFTSYDLGLTIRSLRFAPGEHLLVVRREGKS